MKILLSASFVALSSAAFADSSIVAKYITMTVRSAVVV